VKGMWSLVDKLVLLCIVLYKSYLVERG